MYVLRNATGNVVRHTNSERKRDELLRMGYEEEDFAGAKPYVPKKKATKKPAEEAKV